MTVMYTIPYGEYADYLQKWGTVKFEELSEMEQRFYKDDPEHYSTREPLRRELIKDMNNLARRMRLVRGIANSGRHPKTVQVDEETYFSFTDLMLQNNSI